MKNKARLVPFSIPSPHLLLSLSLSLHFSLPKHTLSASLTLENSNKKRHVAATSTSINNLIRNGDVIVERDFYAGTRVNRPVNYSLKATKEKLNALQPNIKVRETKGQNFINGELIYKNSPITREIRLYNS